MHPQDTVYISKPLLSYIYLWHTSSTNDYATENLATINGPNTDICIYTYNQSAGRGQIGRKWFGDTDKNIACSYVKHFKALPIQKQFYLNMAYSLACHDLISSYIKKPVHIKWPNDIYVNNKKIAGILIQNMLRADIVTSSIMGIGLNVNTLTFPADLPNPTSLSLECQQVFNLLEVLKALSLCIQKRLSDFQTKLNDISEEYSSLMYRKNQPSKFIKEGQLFSGVIKGVMPEGHLVVEVAGKDVHFGFRDIEYVI